MTCHGPFLRQAYVRVFWNALFAWTDLLAAQTLGPLFPNALMGNCVSHTSCHAGGAIKDEEINDLVQNILALFSHASGNTAWHMEHFSHVSPLVSFVLHRVHRSAVFGMCGAVVFILAKGFR
jgi:hypothetical protein